MNQSLCYFSKNYLNNFFNNDLFIAFVIVVILLLNISNGVKFFTSITTCVFLSQFLKFIIKAPLPYDAPYDFSFEAWQNVRSSVYSMPSGHSVFSCIFTFSLILRTYNLVKNKSQIYIRWHKILSILVFALLLIKCHTIYHCGFNFTIDVVFGFIYSLIYLLFLEFFIFKKKIGCCI